MAIWVDPLLASLKTPSFEQLKANALRLGRLEIVVSPHQWQMVFAPEEFLGWASAVRSGKSIAAALRGLRLSLWIPNNKGLVGRLYATDLEDTAQALFNEYADQTGMVKDKNSKETILYCCDKITGDVLPNKPTSNVRFRHLDNVDHLKSQGFGWAWLEEASELPQKAFLRVADRLSHPAAEGQRSLFVTANAEGRNWIWKTFYDSETILKLPDASRLKRRSIHNKTTDNPFLSQEYIDNLRSIYPAEWIQRYMDGSFDVFEGQIHKHFSPELHVLPSGVFDGRDEPPREWDRMLAVDVGGAMDWGWEWGAVDPYGNIVMYDEINEPGDDIDKFIPRAKQKMEGLNFRARVLDYENKLASRLLAKHGIHMTNARKVEKMVSVLAVGMYF